MDAGGHKGEKREVEKIMLKDLENYARFVQCLASTAATAELAILGVGGDLAPYLKAESENSENGAGEWIQATLGVVGPLAARADFYATLLYDAAGDPELAREVIAARRKNINDPSRWTKAARAHFAEDLVPAAAEAGRRVMDYETTLALALLNRPEKPADARKKAQARTEKTKQAKKTAGSKK